MADKRDYYEVLGLNKGASDDEIKKAYRQSAKKYHPDLHPGDKDCEEKFKEVNEAYEVLSDKEKRARYDQFGHAGVDPNYGAGAGGYGGNPFSGNIDLDDIFSSFFGGFGGRRGRSANQPQRGSDINASVTISFEEAAKGCKKTVSYNSVDTCDACHGTGKIIDQPCRRCNGSGRNRKNHTVDVTIPAGIKDQMMLNVSGHGNAGYNGGPKGDLHVTVNVRRHNLFERRGDDVWCDLPVTFSQAILGSEVVVPTLDGKVNYSIHEGTQPNDVFRLKGRGIPHLGGRGRGDQYCRVVVEIPKNLNQKQKELVRQFESTANEKNYAKRKSFFDKLKEFFNE